ncbi:adhesion G-protein coupled receptor G6-like isoform X2 [Cololabis saira]|uniref:adhesion G-protein coupled receptor G6-like isoform X2 n=1 Tax=Cololabis saira TaxID=129043 RepID=UPI002AD3A56D|nr:adhesion G-protein coupled receptor G6-like isoform X2 [Cololabis saira]
MLTVIDHNNMIRWIILFVFVAFLWINPVSNEPEVRKNLRRNQELGDCYKGDTVVFLEDNFYGIYRKDSKLFGENCKAEITCFIFLQKNDTKQKKLWKMWAQVGKEGKLFIPKVLKSKEVSIYFLTQNCSQCIPDRINAPCQATWDFLSKELESVRTSVQNDTELKSKPLPILSQNCSQSIKDCINASCQASGAQTCIVNPVKPEICKSDYDEDMCRDLVGFNDKYLLDVKEPKCSNCNNPIKVPDEEITLEMNSTANFEEGKTDATAAVDLMGKMSNLVSTMNGTSASLSVGEAKGILVRQSETSDMKKVDFAYESSDDPFQIIEDDNILASLSRSVSVSKEAFDKVVNASANITAPFVAVVRFLNMTPDEYNRTTLGNEVIGVEMGAVIKNLTNKININFRNIIEEGNATCYSWNGEGGKPNWTDEGCETKRENSDIICECSHLTFFAILMTPLNQTISSSDLRKLTIITQVGCGLSMFFLCIVLFMHFLMRKTKANISSKIFIHLVFAMCLLNLSFLINNYVGNMKNSVGCKIMAAVMHYSMLATFSWFAAQGLHLCLQLHGGGRGISIHHPRYELKISVPSWTLPGIVVIALLAAGKYGEQTIYTDNPEDDVAMCWITDNSIHYAVNVGYYALVFLFTFTTVIITVSWLFCLRRSSAPNKPTNQSGRSIVIILGLCCLMGITWGFAFFAHGSFRMPAYYIFTILNSFQGFFLFIYYYNTRQSGEMNAGVNGKSDSSSTSSTSTLKTTLDNYENPYLPSAKAK